MNSIEVIKLHQNWKCCFRSAIVAEEMVDIAIVGSDFCCEFGEWLFSEGKKQFGHREEWKDCVSNHAKFHLEAAKIARKINSKSYFAADQMMLDGTPFSCSSAELILAVNKLFESVKLRWL
jgi:hypothetical protein